MSILLRSVRSLMCFSPRRSKGSYKTTINHPKFPFSIHPTPGSRSAVNVSNKSEYFQKQCKIVERPTFILHDGPPYANGNLHVGHALNKFLKDVAIRYHILRGQRVNFVPGWDCHGLPIELKAKFEVDSPSATSAIASHYIQSQKESFSCWGVLGDWSHFYATMNPSYEAEELQAFSALHSKVILSTILLPTLAPLSFLLISHNCVYRTALAESELEYNTEHVSKSLYFKVHLINATGRLFPVDQVYAVIWTTTPWTLPANEAQLNFIHTTRYDDIEFLTLIDLFESSVSLNEKFGAVPFRSICNDYSIPFSQGTSNILSSTRPRPHYPASGIETAASVVMSLLRLSLRVFFLPNDS
ncbi:unnamed protein product [Echinostoma caproni]|uniref:isoleucine--tRNA ligase n=1 Tax=Echinostoma caproni TaxID=27848 RepID=A0A183A231_9TREM|nr:unnamed protein product [Echinostoma caproni]